MEAVLSFIVMQIDFLSLRPTTFPTALRLGPGWGGSARLGMDLRTVLLVYFCLGPICTYA